MPTYAFEAVDRSGQAVRGVDTAKWIGEVSDRLRRRDLTIVGIREAREGWRGKIAQFLGWETRLPSYPTAVFFRQLSTMVKAGVPLASSMENLLEQGVDKRVDETVFAIQSEVLGGSTLSRAFEMQGAKFPPLTAPMLRAAENSGKMDEMLERIALYLEQDLALEREWKKASFYPLTIFAITSLITLGLVTHIFPRFIAMFRGLDVELPVVTRVLVTLTETFSNPVVFFPLILGLISTGALLAYQSTTPVGRRQLDLFRLEVPYFGTLANRIALARVARTFGLLIDSGVPTLKALRIAGSTAGNSVISDAMERVAYDIEKGSELSKALAKSERFPRVFVDLARAGEESGEIPEMMARLAEMFEQDTRVLVALVTSMVEPVMIAVMGIAVLFVLVAVFGPVYQLMALF